MKNDLQQTSSINFANAITDDDDDGSCQFQLQNGSRAWLLAMIFFYYLCKDIHCFGNEANTPMLLRLLKFHKYTSTMIKITDSKASFADFWSSILTMKFPLRKWTQHLLRFDCHAWSKIPTKILLECCKGNSLFNNLYWINIFHRKWLFNREVHDDDDDDDGVHRLLLLPIPLFLLVIVSTNIFRLHNKFSEN